MNTHLQPPMAIAALTPFVGRRLHGCWRSVAPKTAVTDLWLSFCDRPGVPGFVHLSALPVQVLPGYVSGGGPTTPSLCIEVADALAHDAGESWYPFAVAADGEQAPFQEWALTEVWLSAVASNVDAPGGYCLQDVCGGLALHFSNTRGPDSYGNLLGMVYEHHDMDAPHEVFCDPALPPLIGSGAWRRCSYLKKETHLDDADVRHFFQNVFAAPALAGCTNRLTHALREFSDWFVDEPGTNWLTPASTKRWLEHHRRHLDKVTQLFLRADEILRQSTVCGDDLKASVVSLGLGTWFGPAWSTRDGADAQDDLPPPPSAMMVEIRQSYAPVREAYRQWFVLLRQACTDETRRRVRWTYEPSPPWVLTLDAALVRGSLPVKTLLDIAGAHLLRDDFQAPWEECEDCTWFVQQGGLRGQNRQDVLIEGDEEHTDSLRITWWPMPQRRDRVIVIRVPRQALIDWWEHWSAQGLPMPFDEPLGGVVKFPCGPQRRPDFYEIVRKAAQPPGFDAERIKFPPYTADDIRDVYLQCMQGRPAKDWPQVCDAGPELVWACDSRLRLIPLLVGRDVHPLSCWSQLEAAAQKVVFPSLWPATWDGRGPFYLMWIRGYPQEEKAEGLDFRPYNWLLPVVRQVPVTEGNATVLRWRWGVIDIEGRFVLPCQFPSMSFPETRGLGKPIQAERPLPASRREPWCWVWVGEAEHAQRCLRGDNLSAPGDVIEVWSGVHPLQKELTARELQDRFALVSKKDGGADGPLGLFNLATGRCGPIRWRYIQTSGLSFKHVGPAQCFETGLWTYVDENGEALLPAEFARTEGVDSGLATAQLGLAQADALGLALTLPDGSQQGPVGVFGPRGAKSLGQWFLAPRWRDVLGEYDGHFVVQNTVGDWGMVTPEGEAVTSFWPRKARDEINRDLLQQVIQQFKRDQKRRFLGWLNEALAAGSLGVMTDKLRSSFGKYDYGALSSSDIPVRLLREVTPVASINGSEQASNTLPAGSKFAWSPTQRNYFGWIDLRTQCAIGPRSERRSDRGYDDIRVPWDALVIDLPPSEFGSDTEQQQFECLKGSEHLRALHHLLEVLCPYIDLVDCESVSAFHPALKAATSLQRGLLNLVWFTMLNDRDYGKYVLNCLRFDLPEIDFANVPINEAPAEQPSIAHDAPPWSKPPELQPPWSEAVLAAHQQALKAYRVWESVFLRCLEIH